MYSDYPFSSLSHVIIFEVAFILLQMWLRWTKAKLPIAPALAKINNCCYACLSGMFCMFAVYALARENFYTSIESLWCAMIPESVTPLFYLYFLSRYWESLDIVLVSLMGYPLNAHFVFHHNTTLFLMWSYLQHPTASALTFMIMNTFMHFWLYLYFAGLRNAIVFKITRIMGHLQLLGGIFCSFMALWTCPYASSTTEYVQIVLLGIYFLLFQLEIIDDNQSHTKKL